MNYDESLFGIYLFDPANKREKFIDIMDAEAEYKQYYSKH